MIRIGADVGGTFTDLVSWDGRRIVTHKLPSTPPQYEQAVIEGVLRLRGSHAEVAVVHGSTVATNALLQRAGAPIAFITTEGFRDMLLIGRQNRPALYDLRVRRPATIAPTEHCFAVRERVDAAGRVIVQLGDDEIDRVIAELRASGLRHAAVCLLFSFINPEHEQRLAARCAAAGITVSLSSDVLPEFREYERASTTAINATLRPVVQEYLQSLEAGLGATSLRVMHSGGGTFGADDAARIAARMVLSGPAGGVIGAAFVARLSGIGDCVTYDMGGTSTDVAVIRDGRPQWATTSVIDGLPIGLPMFDIHTVGAGGGSIAFVDAGGALRVGPRSAGARPGPACYGRGGDEPTVTDANVVLGRIRPERFLGGAMRLDIDSAHRVIARLGQRIGLDPARAALGIVTIVQNNMSQAVRAVTARRGIDPRDLALVSFGGAGGLHACAMAEMLDIQTVVLPPYCGVLSALGMVVAAAEADCSQTVLHSVESLDDPALRACAERLRTGAVARLGEPAEVVKFFADARFNGQSHELAVAVDPPAMHHIESSFLDAYARMYGTIPSGRRVEIVTLRARARGAAPRIALPPLAPVISTRIASVKLTNFAGASIETPVMDRAALASAGPTGGPILLLDADATALIPSGWIAQAREDGTILARRSAAR
jgi:N-methylhydantoinase A